MDGRRKHRVQMDPYEQQCVETLVRSQKRWTVGPHARDRMIEKGVFMKQVYDVLKSGYVIEVNGNKDLCVTFRKEYFDCSVCVVVSLATRWVVTVWKNNVHDTHETLDTSKYQWHANMSETLACYASA